MPSRNLRYDLEEFCCFDKSNFTIKMAFWIKNNRTHTASYYMFTDLLINFLCFYYLEEIAYLNPLQNTDLTQCLAFSDHLKLLHFKYIIKNEGTS